MPFPMTFNSQEDFDNAVSERLSRERAKYSDYDALKAKAGQYDALSAQDYPGQLSAMKAKADTALAELAELTKKTNEATATNSATIADLQAKLAAAELSVIRSQVCSEVGLPATMATRLQGSTEEEIRADAKNLAKFVAPQVFPANPEPAHGTGGGAARPTENGDSAKDAAIRNLAKTLFAPKT